jgi:hypothetical protein
MNTVDVTCYYHAPLKAALIRDAVLPALRRARADGLDGYLERHWLHGPHVRIRLEGPAAATVAAAETATGSLRDYLATHPSDAGTDTATLLARSVEAGRAELVPGPYEPIHPDNTVRVEPADDRHVHALLAAPQKLACRAELLRAGIGPIEATTGYLTTTGNTTDNRVWLTLRAMAVHAAAYPPGIAGGYQSFLSHLEDFLYLHDQRGKLRERFAAQWQRHAPRVREEVARATAASRTDPVITAWADWETRAWGVCAAAASRGDLPMPGDEYRQQARKLAHEATERRFDPGRRGYSLYHLALKAVDFLTAPGIAEHFGAYRFATNVFYLVLAICDVTPIERYLAAYLLSEAVQESSGISWKDAMAAHRGARGRAMSQWWGPPADNAIRIGDADAGVRR